MRNSKGKSLQEILGKLKPEQNETVEKLRSLTKAVLPNAVEAIKWGNITYLLGENNLSWILIYSDHVDYGFFRGAELNSQSLEGTGKGLRHIRIKDGESLDEKEILRLLRGCKSKVANESLENGKALLKLANEIIELII